jgi:hypothetical protein
MLGSIPQLIPLLAIVTGKNVYDTFDNGEFIEVFLSHDNADIVLNTLMDVVHSTTNSITVSNNIEQYRDLLSIGVKQMGTNDGKLDIPSILQMLSNPNQKQNVAKDNSVGKVTNQGHVEHNVIHNPKQIVQSGDEEDSFDIID